MVARFHLAGREELQQAIDSAMQAREEWERTPFEERSEFIVGGVNHLLKIPPSLPFLSYPPLPLPLPLLSPPSRASIFLRLANLLATKYRPMVLATTMVGQGKTILQAEIDATCELIDFYRFAVQYAMDVYKVRRILSL